AEARERAGTEVLDDDVAFLDEPLEHALAVRILEVDGHAALVAIDREVVRGDPLDAGRRPLTCLVTRPGHLDLDHVRAVIPEHERAVRPRQRAREIEDAYAVERARWLSDHARRVPLTRWRSCFRSSRSPPCCSPRCCCRCTFSSRVTGCWCGAAWTTTGRSAS